MIWSGEPSRWTAWSSEESSISVPGARALVLAEDRVVGPRSRLPPSEREFAHFHPALTGASTSRCPTETADLAIDRGWAELHLIARTEDLPGSVVMVYAPRCTRGGRRRCGRCSRPPTQFATGGGESAEVDERIAHRLGCRGSDGGSVPRGNAAAAPASSEEEP